MAQPLLAALQITAPAFAAREPKPVSGHVSQGSGPMSQSAARLRPAALADMAHHTGQRPLNGLWSSKSKRGPAHPINHTPPA
ncbi:hypothetical protein CKO18_01195 [Rhodoferax fermentans]|uniref:Uncharacterized protein n=1 Tax=Rhodoferax fermentans TaxID=28066 RepID=A0A1T1ARR4_RHOFE|nr:hypothetical protein [Rhodoferax fermentans]OOV06794.1 hypothetical protein RF819_08680 [Rhodoferax fermentans]